MEFNDRSNPRTKEGTMEKRNILDGVNALCEGHELTLNASESGIISVKTITRKRVENIDS